MNIQIPRIRSIGIALILMLLPLTIAGISCWNTQLVHESGRWVAHTHEVVSAIDALLLTTQEAETGERGYLITGNDAYLEPYRIAVSKVPLQIARLRKLTADNPDQQTHIKILEEQIAVRFNELQRIIDLCKGEGFAVARDAVLEGKGEHEMEAIRDQAAATMKVEKDLLEARRRRTQSGYQIGIASEIIAGLLGAALVMFAWHLLRRDFVARLQASAALGEAQRQVNETRALLEVLMASAPVGIAFFDREMRYGSINAYLAEINGFPVEAHIGRTASEIPGIAAQADHLFRQALETMNPLLNLEVRDESSNSSGVQKMWLASWFPVSRENGKACGVGLIVQDITERKRIEEQLRLNVERYRLAIDAAELGTFYCPVPLGPIFWNTKCKEHFWLPPEEDVNFELFYAILHPDDREPTRQAIETALRDHGIYDVEYRTVAPDGQRTRWIRAKGCGYYDAQGALTRFDGITIEITGPKQIQAERDELLIQERRARAQVEQASQAKDEFLATLSHELRSPLMAILGWTQLLRSTNQENPATWKEGLAVIERNTHAQVQLIEDLLDISRIISGKLRMDVCSVDLPAVIKAAIDVVQPTARAREIRLETMIDPRAGPVPGDPNRLQQVAWNLLSNAIKFTPKRGRVQVILARINSHVEITVSDTGKGIPAEFLPHVFERFTQLDSSSTRAHQGLGLGLAICRHLVELHGGSIYADSEGEDKGSTFRVKLPLAIALDPSSVSVAETRVHPLIRGDSKATMDNLPQELEGISVLAVDDDPGARRLLEQVLTYCKATVTVVATAQEALEAVEQLRPHVLLCDIEMPGEDGYSLLRRIRALGPERGGNIAAAALTAYARGEDRTRALRAGFQLYVSKPVEITELVTVVTNLAGRVTHR
jgi:PAS domain S-box-containing protein